MCLTIHYKQPTDFVVVETGLLNLYSPSTGDAVVKTCLLNLTKSCLSPEEAGQTNFDHHKAIWKPADVLQDSFYNGKVILKPVEDCHDSLDCCNTCWETVALNTGYAKPLQGFYSFCVCQNGPTTAPKTFNRVCSSQNCLANPLQAFNRLVVVKLCMTILHIHSTAFGVSMTFLYRLSTIFPVVTMCLWNIYRASTGFVVVKHGPPNN